VVLDVIDFGMVRGLRTCR